VLEAELDNILLLRVIFNGVLQVVGLAETSRCRAEPLTFQLCLVYVPSCRGVLSDWVRGVVILPALSSKDMDDAIGGRAWGIAKEDLRP
jgi:hypothetical protein